MIYMAILQIGCRMKYNNNYHGYTPNLGIDEYVP